MYSTIKVDVNIHNKPVIEIKAMRKWDDLRDKMLDKFLSELNPNGRLCFIDKDGAKDTHSGESTSLVVQPDRFTITPIPPENYELLIEEIKILIKERDENMEYGKEYLEERHKKNELLINDKWEFGKVMNY